MKNLNAKMMAASIFAGLLFLTVSAAQAKETELVHGALNHSLNEQVDVQSSYTSNSAALRPEAIARRTADRKIQVDIGDELSVGSDRLKGFDRAEDRSYRENNIAQGLDREMREIDRSFDRETRQKNVIRDL